MLDDLFLLSSSLTIVFLSRFSSLLPIGPPYLPTKTKTKIIKDDSIIKGQDERSKTKRRHDQATRMKRGGERGGM